MTDRLKHEYDWLGRHLPPSFTLDETNIRRSADFIVGRELTRKADFDKVIGAFVVAKESVLWPLQPEYRGKQPAQQWALSIDKHNVQLYNYVPWRKLSDEHAEAMAFALALFEATFPGSIQKLQAITAVDHLKRSPYGDPKTYPAHAEAQPDNGIFAIQGPQALRLHDHYRNQLDVDSLSAVVTHEMVHMTGLDALLAADFQKGGFTWSPERTLSTRQQKIVNGYPVFRADQPRDCVTDYGILDAEEDACESVVAYIYTEPLLHPFKQQAIGHYDKEGHVPSYAATKIDEPSYPLLPERFSYYVEPQ